MLYPSFFLSQVFSFFLNVTIYIFMLLGILLLFVSLSNLRFSINPFRSVRLLLIFYGACNYDMIFWFDLKLHSFYNSIVEEEETFLLCLPWRPSSQPQSAKVEFPFFFFLVYPAFCSFFYFFFLFTSSCCSLEGNWRCSYPQAS